MALQRGQSFSERLQSVQNSLLKRKESIKVEELSLTDWEIKGVQRCMADDFTHVCMEMHWTRLLGFVLGVYGACSFIFACVLYFLDGTSGVGGDVPPTMSPFEICWWFATVNIVTAGFGSMVPVSAKAYTISTAAHLTGLLLNALLLGVIVAKASLPTAKMVFSNVVCVRTRNGIQQLMVRVGNARGNILFSPDIRFAEQFSCRYIHAVTTAEGETYFEDSLLTVRIPAALKPAFTITHPVTEGSPIDGKSEADINKERGFFLLIVSATDVETGQSLYARRLYFMKDFRFNHMFEVREASIHHKILLQDVISERVDTSKPAAPTGSAAYVEGFIRQTKVIDFLRFHSTVPLEADCWKEGREVCAPSRRFGILAPQPEPVTELDDPTSPPSTSPRSRKPSGPYELNGRRSPFLDAEMPKVPENKESMSMERSYSADGLNDYLDQLKGLGFTHLRQRHSVQPDKAPSSD